MKLFTILGIINLAFTLGPEQETLIFPFIFDLLCKLRLLLVLDWGFNSGGSRAGGMKCIRMYHSLSMGHRLTRSSRFALKTSAGLVVLLRERKIQDNKPKLQVHKQ